jgi:hypothetical protein
MERDRWAAARAPGEAWGHAAVEKVVVREPAAGEAAAGEAVEAAMEQAEAVEEEEAAAAAAAGEGVVVWAEAPQEGRTLRGKHRTESVSARSAARRPATGGVFPVHGRSVPNAERRW